MPRICKSSMMDTVLVNLFITLRFRLDGSLRPALADYKVRPKLPPQVAITTYLLYRQIAMLPIGRRFGRLWKSKGARGNQNSWTAKIYAAEF
jgi:hypothetical protein